MVNDHGLSKRQACSQVNLARSTAMYQKSINSEDDLIIDALNKLVEKYPSIGFWKSYYRLRYQGNRWNHKRVYRVYTGMRLNIRRRSRRRLPARVKQALFQPEYMNQVWSIDFMHDSLWDGRVYRLLNIMDDYNREIVAIETDTSIPSLRVIRVLERLKESRGLPEMIRVDNGPEFISRKFDQWCKVNKIKLVFIQPGKPTQNAYVERCNKSIREELLNAWVFKSLDEVRDKVEKWRWDYNNLRPHQALNHQPPKNFLLS